MTFLDELIAHVDNITDSDEMALDSIKFLHIADRAELNNHLAWWDHAIKTAEGWVSED